MDTAQIKCDFLWLGHSLLTVKGDDNQEVAEKLKPELYTKYNHLTSVFKLMIASLRAGKLSLSIWGECQCRHPKATPAIMHKVADIGMVDAIRRGQYRLVMFGK